MPGSEFIKAIRLFFSLKCEQSMQLVSGSLDRELSRSERIALRLHLITCRACRRARRQFLFLREALRRREGAVEGDDTDASAASVSLGASPVQVAV